MEEKPRMTPYPLRMPDELRESLEAASASGNRSLHAEIISRLQASFEPANQSGEIEAIAAERDQQRALAEQFRFIADSSDNIRTLLSAMLLGAVDEMRENGLSVDQHEWVTGNLVEWLSEKDRRGAAFSILRLIDKSNPEVVESLRNFASHLDDLGLVRKPITLVKANPKDAPKHRPRAVTERAQARPKKIAG
jgi:signal transduction histidine kinase